jgi:hypothetical protein
MQTHNRQLDAARAAVQAALEKRPVLQEPQRETAEFIVGSVLHDLRNTYLILRSRPDLTDLVERSAGLLVALKKRLQEEAPKGRVLQ